MSMGIDHVHATHLSEPTLEMTPPHAPRTETAEYKRAHHFLVVEQDKPCEICGVRNSSLHDPAQNPFKATALETHHSPCERSLAEAIDPVKLHKVYPQVYDKATLEAWLDSPANLRVLCSVHHRSLEYGIHHLLYQDFAALPFLKDGYQLVATQADEAAALATDERIEEVSGGVDH